MLQYIVIYVHLSLYYVSLEHVNMTITVFEFHKWIFMRIPPSQLYSDICLIYWRQLLHTHIIPCVLTYCGTYGMLRIANNLYIMFPCCKYRASSHPRLTTFHWTGYNVNILSMIMQALLVSKLWLHSMTKQHIHSSTR